MATKRLFGQDPIRVDHFYLHTRARNDPRFVLVKVRSVSVDEKGFIRVDCSFPMGNTPGEMDEDCYDPIPSLQTFPCYLKAVDPKDLPSIHREACDQYDWRAHGERFVPSLSKKRRKE